MQSALDGYNARSREIPMKQVGSRNHSFGLQEYVVVSLVGCQGNPFLLDDYIYIYIFPGGVSKWKETIPWLDEIHFAVL